MVVRDYLVRKFQAGRHSDQNHRTWKIDKAAEGGSVDVLIYPEGTTAAQIPGTHPVQ